MYIFVVQNTPQDTRDPQEKLSEILRQILSEFGGIMGEARDQVVDPEKVICRPMEVVFCPEPWHRGRVVLLGDAAHATTPHLASGAGMAIEDAIVLAEELANKESLQSSLDGYMNRRYARSKMVYDNSIQLGEWEKNPSDPDADPAGLYGKSLDLLAQPL